MDEQPFSGPSLQWPEPNANCSPIKVLLSGEMEAEGQSGWCIMRSIAQGRVLLETNLRLAEGVPVRITLRGNRHLLGEVEDHESGLVAVRFQRIPEWILDLFGRQSVN